MAVGWNDASELIVAGDGEVYVAAVGTALPISPTASLNSAFHGLGFLTEDGVSKTVTPSVTEFPAWQSTRPIRRERDTIEEQIVFSMQQWNEDTIPFAYGGGAVSDLGGGNYRYDPPLDTDQLAERAMVIDVNDGTERHRIVIPRGNVTDAVETQFHRKDTAKLPVTFKALVPTDGGTSWYQLTNSDALVTGS